MTIARPMTTPRVSELDLLRFLAALSVVLFHYSFRGYAADNLSSVPYPALVPVTKYAFLGVELFFLISGFVILMTAANADLKRFVVSRAARLYPAFWVSCTATFLAITLFGGDRFSASVGQYLANMTLLSGFVGIRSIDGVYWSLFVELKFYAGVALILVLGRIHQTQGILMLWLLATLALTVMPIGILRSILITDYAPYFIAGAMSFLIWSKGASPARVGTIVAAWLLALYQSGINIAEFENHYHTHLDGRVVASILSVFFAILLLVALRRTGFLGRRSWLTLGAITYPLYLLHQTIGYLILNAGHPTIAPLPLLIGTVLLMILASFGVHVLLERQLAARLKIVLNSALNFNLLRAPRPS